ncbi:unnamed protein product, partial [Pylaiella littoralis]
AGKKRSSTTDLTPSPPSTRRSSSRRKQAPTVDSDQDAEARPGTEEKKPASGASDENAVVMMARSMGMQMVPANSSGYYPPVGASPAQANQVFGGVNAVPLAGGLMSPQGGFIHAFAQPAGGHPFSQAQ